MCIRDRVISAFLYDGTCKFEVFHMVLGKVMDLHQSAGPQMCIRDRA